MNVFTAHATAAALVPAVREHAIDNYENGGWDILVECWSDDDIISVLIENESLTESAAIAAIAHDIGLIDDYRADIIASGR